MSMLNKTAFLAVVALLGMGSQMASAVGLGRPSHTTMLGQTLDLVVPVSADGTEQLTSECISTEILVGDTRVPASAVRSRLEWVADSGTRVLRVTSSVRIDEPVVTVTVAAGCPVRLTRQFVLFIDPPPQAASDPASATPQIAETALVAPAAVSSAAAQVAPAELAGSSSPDLPAARRPLALAKPPSAVPARALSPAPVGIAGADEIPTVRKPSSPKPARSLKPSPRLQLEADARPAPSQAAASAVADLLASAASAAAAAASEAQATAQRQREAMESLQKQMELVKAQADAANKSIAQMQSSLRESQESSNGWLLVAGALAAAVVALLAAVVWLLRQRSAASEANAAWWNAEPNKPEASAEPRIPKSQRASDDLPSELELPFSESLGDTNFVMPSGWQASQVPAVVSSGQEPVTIAPMPADSSVEHDRAPFLTADELIDLGQQADFLVALGQDDSAISLLDGQLPMGGGGGAWPYLKVLEIHRRREDQTAFERVRERFERRFGVSPADWRDGLVAGKSLDAYDGVIKRIEAAWVEPEEALRLIETLMVRGDDNVRFFDLAAMGDLQSLYLLAKSLLEPVPSGLDAVDLLLPFDLESDELVETQSPALEPAVAVESTIEFTLELPPSAGDSTTPR